MFLEARDELCQLIGSTNNGAHQGSIYVNMCAASRGTGQQEDILSPTQYLSLVDRCMSKARSKSLQARRGMTLKTIVVGHSVQRKSAKLDCPVALMHWMGCCTALRSRCDSNSLLQIIEVLATIGPGCHACLLVLGHACLLKTSLS